MVRRQIQQPMMSFRDVDGVWRHALKGESVDVAADDLQRFDPLNFGPDYTPKKRGPAKTEPTPTSRRSTKRAAAKKAAPRKRT